MDREQQFVLAISMDREEQFIIQRHSKDQRVYIEHLVVQSSG